MNHDVSFKPEFHPIYELKPLCDLEEPYKMNPLSALETIECKTFELDEYIQIETPKCYTNLDLQEGVETTEENLTIFTTQELSQESTTTGSEEDSETRNNLEILMELAKNLEKYSIKNNNIELHHIQNNI